MSGSSLCSKCRLSVASTKGEAEAEEAESEAQHRVSTSVAWLCRLLLASLLTWSKPAQQLWFFIKALLIILLFHSFFDSRKEIGRFRETYLHMSTFEIETLKSLLSNAPNTTI